MSGKTKSFATLFAIGLLCQSGASSPALARQITPKGTVADGGAARREAILKRETDIARRDLLLRTLRDRRPMPRGKRDKELALAQIMEDFKLVQVACKDMMLAQTNGLPLDYKLIEESAKEINKRAKQLKSNLAIPDLEKSEEESGASVSSFDDAQMRASLLTLNELIKSFVTNPLFHNLNVANVQHLTKAQRDITDIIRLSQSVRKSAERLKKHS